MGNISTYSPEQDFSDWDTSRLKQYLGDLKNSTDGRDRRTKKRVARILSVNEVFGPIRSQLECFDDENSSKVDIYKLGKIQSMIAEATEKGMDTSEFDNVDWEELERRQAMYKSKRAA